MCDSTIFCIDNSECTRNGDFAPNRLMVQQEAITEIIQCKFQRHPLNDVALLNMAGPRPQVMVPLCRDRVELSRKLYSLQSTGESDPLTSLRIAQLLFKHRQGARLTRRVMLFIASSSARLKGVDRLKSISQTYCRADIHLEIIVFGTYDEMTKATEQFQPLIAQLGDHCQLLTVTADSIGIANACFASLRSLAGASRASHVEDPEMAMALYMSLQEMKKQPAPSPRTSASTSGISSSSSASSMLKVAKSATGKSSTLPPTPRGSTLSIKEDAKSNTKMAKSATKSTILLPVPVNSTVLSSKEVASYFKTKSKMDVISKATSLNDVYKSKSTDSAFTYKTAKSTWGTSSGTSLATAKSTFATPGSTSGTSLASAKSTLATPGSTSRTSMASAKSILSTAASTSGTSMASAKSTWTTSGYSTGISLSPSKAHGGLSPIEMALLQKIVQSKHYKQLRAMKEPNLIKRVGVLRQNTGTSATPHYFKASATSKLPNREAQTIRPGSRDANKLRLPVKTNISKSMAPAPTKVANKTLCSKAVTQKIQDMINSKIEAMIRDSNKRVAFSLGDFDDESSDGASSKSSGASPLGKVNSLSKQQSGNLKVSRTNSKVSVQLKTSSSINAKSNASSTPVQEKQPKSTHKSNKSQ